MTIKEFHIRRDCLNLGILSYETSYIGLWKPKPVTFVWPAVVVFCIPLTSTDYKVVQKFLLYDNHMRGKAVVMAVSCGNTAEIFCAHATVSVVWTCLVLLNGFRSCDKLQMASFNSKKLNETLELSYVDKNVNMLI